VLTLLSSCTTTSPKTEARLGKTALVSFNRDIRPLLSDNCYKCHGPNEESRERNLRLDSKEGLFGKTRDGFAILDPGDVNESEIYLRLIHEDPKERMLCTVFQNGTYRGVLLSDRSASSEMVLGLA
jgi:hypothetical protein